MTALTVGITGANGYVGRVLVEAVRNAGGKPVPFSSTARAGQRPYQLGRPVSASALSGLSALIHAAHDFSAPPSETHERNTKASLPLLDAAAAAGTPVVLISTLSAFDHCRSAYGQAKLALEQLVFERGGHVLRAGLVFGRGAGGIVGSLAHSIGSAPFTPVFAPHSPTYITEAGALGQLAVHLAGGGDALGRERPVLAAADDVVSFISLVRTVAASQGRRARTVHVPVALGLVALRTGESLRIPLPFRSDSLVALAHAIPADQVARLDRSPVPFPSLPMIDVAAAVGDADRT